MKRFQECNTIVKIWRYRWYILIPFKWFGYMITIFFSKDKSEFNGIDIWRLFLGDAQIKMNWTYTYNEVMDNIKNKLKKKNN